MKSKFGFGKITANFERLKRQAPTVIGNMAQNFFVQSFNNQGFTDREFERWKPRKGQVPRGGLAMVSKRSDSSRNILVKSGTLRSAVNTSLKTATWDNISFSVDLKYAAIHNDGLVMKNGANMPKRKFIGNSYVLLTKIDRYLRDQMAGIHR